MIDVHAFYSDPVIVQKQTVRKQNPDPFQTRLKVQGVIPAKKEYSGKQQSVSFIKKGDVASNEYSGAQIMNRRSTYVNFLKNYTNYDGMSLFFEHLYDYVYSLHYFG